MSEGSLALVPSTPTHSATSARGDVPATGEGTVKVPFATVNGPPVDEYPDQLELSSSLTGAGGTVPGTVVVGGADVLVTICPGAPAAR